MSALAKQAATMPILSQLSETECNAFLCSHLAMPQHGLQRPLSSHRVFEKLLRSLKLATRSTLRCPNALIPSVTWHSHA